MKKTTIINLLAGSGSGKSTQAAGVFYKLKMMGKSVELVREFVKGWAWEGRKASFFDQLYIFAKQAKLEYSLFEKVDYIITDSPILLSDIYSKYYKAINIESSVSSYMNACTEAGVNSKYFFLDREKPFNEDGRYETEEVARQIDQKILNYMHDKEIPYTLVNCVEKDRTDFIINNIFETK